MNTRIRLKTIMDRMKSEDPDKMLDEMEAKHGSSNPSSIEWNENTLENPFWKSKVEVEVMDNLGNTKRFKCPKCARGWHSFIKKWRTV